MVGLPKPGGCGPTRRRTTRSGRETTRPLAARGTAPGTVAVPRSWKSGTRARVVDRPRSTGQGLGVLELLPLPPEPLDLQLHDIPGPQERLRLGRTQRHPRRRPGVDHIARVERHELAEVPHDLPDREDLLGRRPVLLELPVDPELQGQVL